MNRLWIGSLPLCFVAGYFAATFGRSMSIPGAEAVSMIVFAWPAYTWVLRRYGWKRGSLVLIGWYAFALGIETFALLTGFPYGRFTYGDDLGFKLFGLTPWTVGLAWSPLFLGAIAVATSLRQNRWQRVAIATVLMIVTDLVLDPGAVAMGYWQYEQGGLYFGVPFSNYIGWIVSSSLAAFLFLTLDTKTNSTPDTTGAISLVWIVAFWTAVCTTSGRFIPAAIGLLGIVLLIRTMGSVRKYFPLS